jgi:ATP-dependent helicase HrpA
VEQTQPELLRRISGCLPADRRRLHASWQRIRTLTDGRAHAITAVLEQIERAEGRVRDRVSRIPVPTYPLDLPVSARREEIAQAISQNQVVVVCGETGSGKTTQLPKICLELGRGVMGMIGHTQPRRIAARSVAQRIAEELSTPLGAVVGYKVRFGDKTGPNTVIKVMTDGVLLAETQRDRYFEQYDTLIIDEAHERSLNIDFLLGYIKTLLRRRRDLKVIITSATIDPDRFSRHFDGAPIITVSGRTYPVEMLYRPPRGSDEDERDSDMARALLAGVDECASLDDGDILVFLSGEREIREAAELLERHHVPGARGKTIILPLYAKLSADEQQRVFQPATGRKIVLATNVAETSLTVPGIRCVVDTGEARLSRYSARTKVQRLEVEAISQASAQQRAGRCGRIGPGICVRLYDEEDFRARPVFTDPEIVRTNLASVILQMASLRLGRVDEFPFLDPPDPRLVQDGYDTLHELGAVTEAGELTPLGRDLAKLPVDPRIGRMVLAAKQEDCLTEILVIASAMSIQDPRDRPADKQAQADECHAAFRDERSDFLGWLKLWREYRDRKRHLSSSKLRRWCRDNFLSYIRIRELDEVHRQLAELTGSLGMHPSSREATPEAIHRALLAGLLSNVGLKSETGEYVGARGMKFLIHPSSSLHKSGTKWVMAGELVRTSRLYARTIAPITPDAIERASQHLVKRSHYDPHWSRDSGRVTAFERVSLYGLELVAKRRVHYGPIDPVVSRKLFIHHALVECDSRIEAPFMEHNRRLVASLRELEARARRTDLVSESSTRFDYFERRVPREICDVAGFERWWKQASRHTNRLLFLTPEDLVAEGAEIPTREAYPDKLRLGDVQAPLSYEHKVGQDTDGVTVRLPLEALSGIDPASLDWLIPGMIHEKIETLLRALPKDYRRLLPSMSGAAQQCRDAMPWGVGPFFERLAAAIDRVSGVKVPADVLRSLALPNYLRIRMEVFDAAGAIVYQGRDFAALRSTLTPRARAEALAVSDARYRRDGITAWDFDELPVRIDLERLGAKTAAFPGLVDNQTSVSMRLFDTAGSASDSTRLALRRLFAIDIADDLRRYTSYFPGIERMSTHFAPLGGGVELRAGLQACIIERAFLANGTPIRTQAEYRARRAKGLSILGDAVSETCTLVETILREYHALRLLLDQKHPAGWRDAIDDIRDQVSLLIPRGFLLTTPFDRLTHYPRYLRGISTRLRKLPGEGVVRDRKNSAEISPYWRGTLELEKRREQLGLDPLKVAEFRWLCEEYRVSLFAQELRTPVVVSGKRLQELWAEIVK